MHFFIKRQLTKACFIFFLVVTLSVIVSSWSDVSAVDNYQVSLSPASTITFDSIFATAPISFIASTSDPLGVIWTVTSGAISTTSTTTMTYTLPAGRSGTFSVTATPVSNPHYYGEPASTTDIYVTPLLATINPTSVYFSSLTDVTPVYFSAATTDPGGVIWKVSAGSISTTSSTTMTYTPHNHSGSQNVYVAGTDDPTFANSNPAGTATVTITPYDLSVTPKSTVFPSVLDVQQIQFVATTNDPQGARWSTNAGTIGANTGLYTPNTVSGTAVIDAISRSDDTTHTSASVVIGNIPISITPSLVVLGHNEQTTFSVTTPDSLGVTWLVDNPGDGAIDSSGNYTSPGNNGIHDVFAMANSDTNSYKKARVCVADASTSPCLAVLITNSTTPLVYAGTPVTFTATSTDGSGVVWSVEANVMCQGFCDPVDPGSIDSNGVYTPPVQSGFSVTVTATSVNNPNIDDSIDLTLLSHVSSVAISPLGGTVDAEDAMQFTADVVGGNAGVTWSVGNGFCESASCPPNSGSINQSGLYTASVYDGVYNVVAISIDDPSKFDVVSVVVQNGITYVPPAVHSSGRSGNVFSGNVLSPASTTLEVGSILQFKFISTQGLSAQSWVVDEGPTGGTISSGGLYTAPNTPGTYHITASSITGPAQATINVTAKKSSDISISINPDLVTLHVTSATSTLTQQFTAQVLNSPDNTNVMWSVKDVGGGSINVNGLYRAPLMGSASSSVFHVLATSAADPSKVATAIVRINLSAPSAAINNTEPISAAPVSSVAENISTGAASANSSSTSTATTSMAAQVEPVPPPSITSQVVEQVGVVTQQFADAANSTAEAIKTPTGSTIVDTVSTVGVAVGVSTWTFTSLMASPIFASPLVVGEIFFVPFRLLGLAASALGLKRRRRPWGTIYDSVTKMPIDPAVVTLYDESNKKISTSITDLDGRFGFIVPKGTYHISVQKTNYVFPSTKLAQKTTDELYSNLYFGEPITVTEDGSVIYRNIPMDPKHFDWNEFTKNKMGVMKFHSGSERFNAKVGDVLFWLGFVVGLVSVFVIPHLYSISILSLYVVLIALRLYNPAQKAFGTITDSANHPLSFAAISVYSKDLQRELFKKVADQYGRYYVLVPKGQYEIKVSRKNPDESYTEVYDHEVDAKNGVINGAIRV